MNPVALLMRLMSCLSPRCVRFVIRAVSGSTFPLTGTPRHGAVNQVFAHFACARRTLIWRLFLLGEISAKGDRPPIGAFEYIWLS
ncbi:hypothetical protein JTE90_011795 [Oedothorax gibbosus]|uniref:Secreted protein n=1 Tax=Oedothorax gibbosus TaxID=931172 RepID=A0AAV6VUG2_9ARAC|nr:hypothetical protein JTE90_011795 [Oedothorax gibbosus]